MSKLTSPNPLTLICTLKPDGTTNLAAVSWWTYLSFNPGMLAFAMAKPSYSGEMARENKSVVLTIPGAELTDIVIGCGSTTGRNTDKAEKFGIQLEELDGCEIKIPAHSCAAAVCELKEYHETGDHYLYICNVKEVYGDEDENALFAWNGYSQLNPAEKVL